MAAAAHSAGWDFYNTILIVSVNKLFIFSFVENILLTPFAIYCMKNKTKRKTYPHPTPPPIIRTILLYTVSATNSFTSCKRDMARTLPEASEMAGHEEHAQIVISKEQEMERF